ncbi:MAG: hypothetical protein FWD47_00660 [Treponema sp.]|nr:hypothetical protein [Treponema sp.]
MSSIRLLRITLIAGFILTILAGGVFSFILLVEGNIFSSTRQQDNFNRSLRDFDIIFSELMFTESEFNILNSELDRLERRAVTVESWLSILKRRKAVADIHPPSMVSFRISIENALRAYPSSQQIIAVAAANLIKNTAINNETEQQLRDWLPLITDPALNNLRLSIHVLLGDFRNPQRASALPYSLFSDGTESISINLAVLKLLRNDIRAAASDINAMLNFFTAQNNRVLSVPVLRLAAEYHYDFGDLLRSAEIFSNIVEIFSDFNEQIPSEQVNNIIESALSRQADALYLAGYTDIAAAIWRLLSQYSNETSLYNISYLTDDPAEAASYLERLVNNIDNDPDKNSRSALARQFGLIRYSRTFDYYSAISLLQNSLSFSPLEFPYIDLEICKRHAQSQILGRQIAETWLLLDRHEMIDDLYKWAVWHFFFQQSIEEAKIILDRFNLLNLSASWIDEYRAIYLMNEGYLDAAENIFNSLPAENTNWTSHANYGRLLETFQSFTKALEQYEEAAAKVQNPKDAARVQVRIARCFTALNRHNDASRALLYALELDPQNLTVRLELDRAR